MIDFNVPPFTGREFTYMKKAVQNRKICGDGEFTKKDEAYLNDRFGFAASYLTTSGTAALEMAALLTGIGPGDEVILPSYTFCSTADAFVQRGAKLVFVDIRPDTMNIDERLIEDAITDRTKVIAVVDYAGVACDMDQIREIADRHHLRIVEDAAQAVGSYYKDRPCGLLGDFGCFSFHETKNYSMGEGGAILLPDLTHRDQAEIYREKGTDRSQFFRGQIDKYTWRDYGSSYLPSDLNAAYLWAQLEQFDLIMEDRLKSWKHYQEGLRDLADAGYIELPYVPEDCKHNAHMFYIKTESLQVRTDLIAYLKAQGVWAVFHYIPLHSSPAGQKFGRFHGEDLYTTRESERLLRLPLYFGLTGKDCQYVIDQVHRFFLQR